MSANPNSGSVTMLDNLQTRTADHSKVSAAVEADFLTVKEAATFLRCSKSYLDKLRCQGGGPTFVRAGMRKILYRRVDLIDWMRGRRYDNTSQYVE